MGETELSQDIFLKFSLQPLRSLRSKDIEGLNFQVLTSNFLFKLVQSSALHFPVSSLSRVRKNRQYQPRFFADETVIECM